MRIPQSTKILLLALLPLLSLGAVNGLFAQDVIRASGGTNISIDSFISGEYTTLSGPTIRETSVAQLTEGSTIILTLPPGFEWNSTASIDILVEPVGANNTDLEIEYDSFDGNNAIFNVTSQSRTAGPGQGPGRVTFSGLEVRPTSTDVPNEGQISNTGTTGPNLNYGDLSTTQGTAAQVLVETAADGSGSVLSEQSILAGNQITVYSISRDAGGNFIENVALDDATNWSLINISGGIPLDALTVANNRRSATFASLVTGSAQIEAFMQGADLTPSETIAVLPRPANAIAIEQQPSASATAGEPFEMQPVIHLKDQFGNLVTTDNSTEVTVEIATGSGTLLGTTTEIANNGVVTFSGLSVEKANTITLRFSGTGLSSATSDEIVISPRDETDLVFLEQPLNTAQNNTVTPPVELQLRDNLGNNVPKDNVNVSVTALDDQGQEATDVFEASATLTVSTNNEGIAIFDNLEISNDAELGEYTLQVSFSGISDPVSSNPFLIILPGDFARFEITDTDGNPIGEQEAGVPFTIRVTALNGDHDILEDFEGDFEGDIELTADADFEGSVQTAFTEADFTNGILETTISLISSGETRVYADFEGIDNDSNSVSRDGRSNIFTVTPSDVDFNNTTITADPEQITADGSSTSTITVQLRDQFQNNLTTGGEIISIETDTGTLSVELEEGSSVTAIDQNDGTYTAALISSTVAGTATVEARNNLNELIAGIETDFIPGPLAEFKFYLPQDNGSPEQQTAGVPFNITVEAVDQHGNRVEGYNGNLQFSSGSNIIAGSTAAITNGLLENHTITLTTSGASVSLSAEDPDVFGVSGTSEPFVVVAAEPNMTQSTVNANPLVIKNDGSATSTVTVTLRDIFGNLVLENLESDLTTGLEQTMVNGSPSSGAPDATIGNFTFNSSNSTYTSILTSGTTIEDVEVTVSFDGSPVDHQPVISIVLPNTWSPGGGPPSQRIDWNREENWSLGSIPGEGSFVVIPGGASDYPDLDQNVDIGSLEIQEGGQLVLFGGNIITVSGFIQVDGTLDIEDNTGLTVGGNFFGSGAFAAGSNAIIELGGNLGITNFWAGADDAIVKFNGSVQQVVETINFLGRRFEILNDVLVTGQNAVMETTEIFITEGNTIEFEANANITVDNLQSLSGSGTLILNDNILVLRGDLDLLEINTSVGTVIFGVNIGDDPANFPELVQQEIQNFMQMKNAVINNPFGVRTFDDIIVDDSGEIILENGELIIGSGRNFIASNITYNNGFLTFRRAINQRGWRMLSTPVGSDYESFFDGLTLQGMNGVAFPDRQPNLLYYDETFEGTDNQRWRTPESSSDNFVAGRGYFFYVFGNVSEDADYNDTLPRTLTASGQENTPQNGDFEFAVTYTAEADTGWNMIGNPFGAAIDWGAASWSKENMDNVIYIWDAVAGEYRYWNTLGGSHGSGKIAPFQGFWVKANSEDPSLSVNPDAKTTGGVFRKEIPAAAAPVLALQVETENHQGITHFTFSENGSYKVDPLDAYRLLPFETDSYTDIFSLFEDGTQLAINNLPRNFGRTIEIPVHIESVADGSFYSGASTITWPEFENIPDSWTIELVDKQSNNRVNLRDTDHYSFDLSAKSKAKTPPAINTVQNFQLLQKTKEKAQSARFRLVIEPGDDAGELPRHVTLNQNFPNPFNPATTIRFGLPVEDQVRIEVYDVLGRRVHTVTNERFQAGFHEVRFDAGSLASGVYIYRLVTSDSVLTKKMTLIK